MSKSIGSSCSNCGKPLSDPISVEFGIGPVCRVSNKIKEMSEKTENLFANRALYDWGITSDGKVIYITDEGGLKSVTNDLENILHDIQDTIPLQDLVKARIMYRDSMGIWDGVNIKFNKGSVIQGISFFPITETKFDKAYDKLLTLNFTPKN